MKTQYGLTLVATAIALGTLAPQTHAATVVAPNQTSNIQLNTALNNATRTYQMQYGASLLSGINIGDQITGLTFRIASTATQPSSSAASFTNWDLTLAQATNTVAGMNTTFASNMTNPVQVRSGALSFAAGAFQGGALNPSTNPFGPVITFTTPYTYQGGDLVVLISHSAGTASVGFLDGVNTTGTNYGTLFRAFAAGTANATTGSQITMTITQFTTSPAAAATPEPSALVGTVAAVALGLGFKRRHTQADKN